MTQIQIHCFSCNKNYFLDKPKKRQQLLLVIDFAICPHCKTKRMPNLWNMLTGDWRCIDCGIGNPFATRKTKEGQCVHCYNADYWKKFVKKVM